MTPIEKQSWVETLESLAKKRRDIYKKLAGNTNVHCRLPQKAKRGWIKWSLGGSRSKLSPNNEIPQISGRTKKYSRSVPNINQVVNIEVPLVSNGPPTPPRRKTSNAASHTEEQSIEGEVDAS